MRIALAQINTIVGDLAGNCQKIQDYCEQAEAAAADLICFPELTLTGYPPEDLLLKPSFLAANLRCLDQLITNSQGKNLTTVVGFVDQQGGEIFDAAAVIRQGRLLAVYHKIYLPNYSVFDEKRYFQSGSRGLVIQCAGMNVGITICEDIWHPIGPAVLETRMAGAELILNLSASPFQLGKQYQRSQMLSVRASDNICYLAYVNLVGAQDELVFDGQSRLLDETGRTLIQASAFSEDLVMADLESGSTLRHRLRDIRHREFKLMPHIPGENEVVLVSARENKTYPELPRSGSQPPAPPESEETASVYSALVLGVRDYIHKNGFSQVFIGLSGGVDSALTAVIAADALGPEQVTGVLLPSPYTSGESREDALSLVATLGIRHLEIPITGIYQAMQSTLGQVLGEPLKDLTDQNLQSRIRGTLLMSLTNQFGGVVLPTGNKSEISAGYATLYGDMAGGFAVLKDLPKTLVYELCYYRNRSGEYPPIPERILTKAPTAELRFNQKDEDDLPAYSLLDQIIEKYIEQDYGQAELVAQGFDAEVVERVISMINRSEYKRRQSPPGVKITYRAFGKDRRMPITNKFKEPLL